MTNEEIEARFKTIEEDVAQLKTDEAAEPIATTKRVWTNRIKPLLWPTAKLGGLVGISVITLLLTQLIQGGCNQPVPPPDPPPIPAPIVPPVPPAPPTPTKSKLIVVFLHDQSKDNATWAKVTADYPTRQTLLAAGHKVRVYDVAQAEYAALHFAPWVAKAGGLPAVVIMQPDGTVRAALAMPADVAGVLKAVNDAGGF